MLERSTLFNRLAGKKIALVDDQPGVTRDRKEAEGNLASMPLILIDTAGYESVHDDSLESRMRAQTEAAIAEAELCLFLVDARTGITPDDETFAQLPAKIPACQSSLAANKGGRASGRGRGDGRLVAGLRRAVGLSAEHGEALPNCSAPSGRPSARKPSKRRWMSPSRIMPAAAATTSSKSSRTSTLTTTPVRRRPCRRD